MELGLIKLPQPQNETSHKSPTYQVLRSRAPRKCNCSANSGWLGLLFSAPSKGLDGSGDHFSVMGLIKRVSPKRCGPEIIQEWWPTPSVASKPFRQGNPRSGEPGEAGAAARQRGRRPAKGFMDFLHPLCLKEKDGIFLEQLNFFLPSPLCRPSCRARRKNRIKEYLLLRSCFFTHSANAHPLFSLAKFFLYLKL